MSTSGRSLRLLLFWYSCLTVLYSGAVFSLPGKLVTRAYTIIRICAHIRHHRLLPQRWGSVTCHANPRLIQDVHLASKYILDTQLTYIPLCCFIILFQEIWMQCKQIIANFPFTIFPHFLCSKSGNCGYYKGSIQIWFHSRPVMFQESQLTKTLSFDSRKSTQRCRRALKCRTTASRTLEMQFAY